LECVRPREELDNSRTLQPDVIIGRVDWDKVEPFIHSSWLIPGQVPLGATTPAMRWHLRVNLKGSPPVYLNDVQLDPLRRRTTITHEAAVRVGQTFHSFYLLFVRTEACEVGSFAADGATRLSERTSGGRRTRQRKGQTSCWMRQALAMWRSSSEPDGRRSVPRAGAREVATGTGGSVL
jgi:hypothetical protein